MLISLPSGRPLNSRFTRAVVFCPPILQQSTPPLPLFGPRRVQALQIIPFRLVNAIPSALALLACILLVRSQSRLPDRKAILYFSQGISSGVKTRRARV
jgi:hypothetical protein